MKTKATELSGKIEVKQTGGGEEDVKELIPG